MEASILKSTKKILGIGESYTAFDLDISTHISAAFSILNQLGVGPADGVTVESDEVSWDSLGLSKVQLNMVKTYIYLKVRSMFDPPATSFLIEATNKQIAELEFRLSVNRDSEKALEDV